HCGTFSASQAFCTGCEESSERPSIVVTDFPDTSLTCVWQEKARLPSTCAMHAPHKPAPQPNFVPLSLAPSRITHRSAIVGGGSVDAVFPLTVNWIIIPSRTFRGTACREGKNPN